MLKIFGLRIARLMGLFAISRVLTRGKLRILCYHGIWQGGQPHYGDCLFMSADRFKQRMDLLARNGYRVISLRQGCEAMANGRVGPRDVVITIDDGWVGTYLHMLPSLEKHGFPATLYVTTEKVVEQEPVLYVLAAFLAERAPHDADLQAIFPDRLPQRLSTDQLTRKIAGRLLAEPTAIGRRAETHRIASLLGIDFPALEALRAFTLMTPAELRDAHKRGLDIQLHTHSHRMHDFEHEHLRSELDLNRDLLAQMLEVAPERMTHFCYPSGLYQPELFPVLKSCGIKSATTTEFGLNPPRSSPYALKRILDCESLSDIELEARLSGFWSLISAVRARIRRAPQSLGQTSRNTTA